MMWRRANRFDPDGVMLADRHYSRQTIGAPQFVKPGRCLVLIGKRLNALWVTSWQEHVKHDWPGAWECALFRNEGAGLSSDLIRDAVAATCAEFGEPPALGMVTFVDPSKVREKETPGWCFIKAGFRPVGTTGSGLLAFLLAPEDMPAPQAAPPRRRPVPLLPLEALWKRSA